MFAVMTSGSTHTDSTKKVFAPNRNHVYGGKEKHKRISTDTVTKNANAH